VSPDDVGKPLSQLRADREGLVLGLVHEGGIDLGIGSDPELSSGDHLLVAEPSGNAP
jgi:hypothetical protein